MPEVIGKRETTTLGTRIVLEQESGRKLLTGEIDANRLLNCSWPLGTDFNTFKRIIESSETGIKWSEKNRVQWGISENRTYVFDPMFEDRMPRGIVLVEAAGLSEKDIEKTLGRITSIIEKTHIETGNLPSNLLNQLKGLFYL